MYLKKLPYFDENYIELFIIFEFQLLMPDGTSREGEGCQTFEYRMFYSQAQWYLFQTLLNVPFLLNLPG
jgi:hypothetical protein